MVCLFEQTLDESAIRLSRRRVDPHTGELYNMDVKRPKMESVEIRLASIKGDDEEIVKKRYNDHISQLTTLEETFKNCLISVASDKTID
jgi:hypothetical protein